MDEDGLDRLCEPYAYDCDDTGTTGGIVVIAVSSHLILPILPFIYQCREIDKSYFRYMSLFNYIAFPPWMVALVLFHTGRKRKNIY